MRLAFAWKVTLDQIKQMSPKKLMEKRDDQYRTVRTGWKKIRLIDVENRNNAHAL